MFWQLFAVSNPLFWIICAGFLAVILAFEEHGKGWWSTLSTFYLLAFVVFLSDFNLLFWVRDNWQYAVYGFLIYFFGCGGVWSIIKWFIKGKEASDIAFECKRQYYSRINTDISVHAANLTSQQRQDLINIIRNAYEGAGVDVGVSLYHTDDVEAVKPRAVKNIDTILMWMIYWPLSVFWFCTHDIIKRTTRAIISMLRRVYNGITDRLFRGF